MVALVAGLAVVPAAATTAAAPTTGRVADSTDPTRRACTIVGTNGPDVLRGGPGDDKLRGGPGDDALYGGGGSQTVVRQRPDALGKHLVRGTPEHQRELLALLPAGTGSAGFRALRGLDELQPQGRVDALDLEGVIWRTP